MKRCRRQILKQIGAGTIIGVGTPSSVSAKESEYNTGFSQLEREFPPSKTDIDIQSFDPYDLSEVRGASENITEISVGERTKLSHRLTDKQKEAIADAHKITDCVVTHGKYVTRNPNKENTQMPKNTPIKDMTSDEDVEILSTSVRTIRNDIGKKWGWER